MALVGLVLFIPEICVILYKKPVILYDIELRDKLNIFLTFTIGVFAAVEGLSTYMNAVLQDKRNAIEDARNELEKAYGPLYTLLNQYWGPWEEANEVLLKPHEKNVLDKKMATYPFMFPSEIYDLWREKIQKSDEIVLDAANLAVTDYRIPLEFRDKINEEYDHRVKRYNELLRK